MGDPLEAGSSHSTITLFVPAVAVTPVGALGAAAGVIAEVATEGAEVVAVP